MSTADSELIFSPAPPNPPAVPVSQLNRLAREALERALPLMWVSGEVSNLVRAASGHLYFTLKDEQAQVRCTLWRNRAQLLPFQLAHGQRVEVRALATLYEARGDYQLNIEAVRQAGLGNLYEAFLRLKQQLEREGLFDPAAKRALPPYPRGIGVVTSPQAAALRDVLATLRRRAPHLPVCLYPAAVQGERAAGELLAAVQAAGRRAAADGIELLLLVRGGGSIEDLWAFNDAALARALRSLPIPVISGVGHETDFTIADFAADLRAATPTAAAEIASAGFVALRPRLDAVQLGLERAMMRRLERASQRLDRAQLALVHPRERLARLGERLDGLARRLDASLRHRLASRALALDALQARLAAHRPRTAPHLAQLDALAQRLELAQAGGQARRRQQLDALAAALGHLDPAAVVQRGYSITRDSKGRIITQVSQVDAGAAIRIELAVGRLEGLVTGRSE